MSRGLPVVLADWKTSEMGTLSDETGDGGESAGGGWVTEQCVWLVEGQRGGWDGRWRCGEATRGAEILWTEGSGQ